MIIIPNENDYLKITEAQKSVCKKLKSLSSKESDFFVPYSPLWIFINSDFLKTDLKDFSKGIKKITLEHFDFSSKWKKFNLINIEGKIETDFKDFGTEKIHCGFAVCNLKTLSEQQKKTLTDFENDFFPYNLKIFRFAVEQKNTTCNSENSFDVEDSVWVKLK